MVKKFMNKRSKRMPARKRYKIEKRVKDHNKKLKKEAKKNPQKKSKKDPGIPNSLPFKDKILQEVEQRKQRAEELKQHQKEQRQNLVSERRGLGDLKKDAEKRNKEFEIKQAEGLSQEQKGTRDSSSKSYYKEFKKVVEAADVVLQVLDARDPLGSRCPQVEQEVLNSGPNKKLVLVLNKIDLIPKDNLVKWLKYLRNEFPTVAFKASTQNQRENLKRSKVPILKSSENLTQSSQCLGASLLMKLLGNYCRNQNISTAIRVGIVGFPNVGKSSIINSLKRSKVCSVGATPGVTRSMQEIQLDKHVMLLDSPGVVLAKGNDTTSLLKNTVKVETIVDPIAPVEAILQRCNRQQLMMSYRIPEFNNVQEFLALLAKRMGRMKKGGFPDVEKAARTLLNNWNTGKIKYYTHPPESHELPHYISAEIVTEMSKPFVLDDLDTDEMDTLEALPNMTEAHSIAVSSSGFTEGVSFMKDVDAPAPAASTSAPDEEWSDIDEMEDDTVSVADTLPENVEVSIASGRSKSRSEAVPKRMKKKVKELEQAEVLVGNQKLNKLNKLQRKREKKKLQRSDKLAAKLSASLDSSLSIGGSKADESYSFSEYYK